MDWEARYDEAALLVGRRELGAALGTIRRLRGWQRRQARYSRNNHDWHDAELLWLEGVALERARQRARAQIVWKRLATVLVKSGRSESWYLPQCDRCAVRQLVFAPSWYAAAQQMRIWREQPDQLAARLSNCARSYAGGAG